MIFLCPNCGGTLKEILDDGLSSCEHCQYVFNSNSYNKLMSASWVLRKWNLDASALKSKMELTDEEANFVYDAIQVQCLTHDEFLKYIKKKLTK